MILAMVWVLTRMNSPMSTSTSEVSKGCSRTIPPNADFRWVSICFRKHPRHMTDPSGKWSDDERCTHDKQKSPDETLRSTSELISCSITASPSPRSNEVENSVNRTYLLVMKFQTSQIGYPCEVMYTHA